MTIRLSFWLTMLAVACGAPVEADLNRSLPVTDAMREVLSGAVAINNTPAIYSFFSVGGREAGVDEEAGSAGWRRMRDVRGDVMSPAGRIEFTGYERDGRTLLVGTPLERGRERNWVVRGLFERRPVWAGRDGEAPGREPAGWPKFPSARRILHLAGTGFEAACSRSPATPAVVLTQTRGWMARRGWEVTEVSTSVVAAKRPDGTGIFLFVREEGRGCTFMVISVTEV